MHILQAWPTFPDLQVQFMESHWRLCVLSLDGSFSISVLVGVSPSAAAGTVVLSLSALLVMTEASRRLVLKGSPTPNTSTTGKNLQLACSGASGDGTTGYGVFVVFLRGVQGTEMVCGSKSCASRCESIRER